MAATCNYDQFEIKDDCLPIFKTKINTIQRRRDDDKVNIQTTRVIELATLVYINFPVRFYISRIPQLPLELIQAYNFLILNY